MYEIFPLGIVLYNFKIICNAYFFVHHSNSVLPMLYEKITLHAVLNLIQIYVKYYIRYCFTPEQIVCLQSNVQSKTIIPWS